MISLRLAAISDVGAMLDICAEARAFQRACGNVQWADDYPSEGVIAGDVIAGRGYVVELDGAPVGYCVVDVDGDGEYDRQPQIWATHEPYAAVHRLALRDSARGKGLSKQVFAEIERIILPLGISIIKVDTGLKNRPLQRLMDSLGFTNRGVWTFPWGQRLAYEKKNFWFFKAIKCRGNEDFL